MFRQQKYYRVLYNYVHPTVKVNKRYNLTLINYFQISPLKNSVRCLSTLKTRAHFDDYEKGRLEHVCKVPEKFNFVSDVLEVWAKKEMNNERLSKNPAFSFVYENGNEVKWSYKDLVENSKRAANVLEKQCGLKKGDSLLVLLPKIPEFWLFNVAAMRTGIVLSPCSMQLREDDIRYRLNALKPKCVVVEESIAELVDKAVADCPETKTKLLVPSSQKQRDGWLNFQSLYDEASCEHQCVQTASDDPMMIFFTSGTTGYPKMVEHTQASLGIGHYITGRYFMDLTQDDVIWGLSDTGWSKTAYSTFGAWIMGASVFIHEMPRFESSVVTKTLQKYFITTFCAPATVYRILLHEQRSNLNFSNLTLCLSGGEPVMDEVITPWEKLTGMKIYGGYGQTETVGLLAMFKCLKFKSGSLGKPPPGMDLTIIDENENELGPNQEGEIAVKLKPKPPVGILNCYKNDPVKTRSQLTENYYKTGDLAYCDEEGFFWFKGRADDIINSAGYRIGPSEVEDVLLKHEAVKDAGVVSSPDSERGEVVKAFIILSEQFAAYDKTKLTEELQAHVKSNTAPYKYPRKIEFVKDLPRTLNGKVKRSDLRRKEWKDK